MLEAETRSILTLLDLAQVHYEWIPLDQNDDSCQNEMLHQISPSGAKPILINENCQLMGAMSIFTNYLTATLPQLMSLMPAHKSERKQVDALMNWY